MSTGMQGYFSVGVESSAGTASGSVTAVAFVPILSETLRVEINPLFSQGLTGRFYEQRAYNGLQSVAGTVEMEAEPNHMGWFLRSAFDATSTSPGSLGSGGWDNLINSSATFKVHRFIALNTQFQSGSGSDLPTLTCEVYRGPGPATTAGSAFGYYNCSAGALEFAIEAGQLARMSVDLIGRDYSTLSARAVSSYPNPDCFMWSQASVSIAGVGTALFESVRIRLDNGLESVPKLDGRLRPDLIKRNRFATVEMNGSISFQSFTDYDLFIAGSERPVVISFTSLNSAQLRIQLPAFRYITFPGPNLSGPGRISIPFTGRAMYHPGSLTPCEFNLVNNKTTSYLVNSTG